MILLLGLGWFSLFSSGSAHSQGCSQCRETIGQTPARTQSAYRKGIAVLVVASTAFASATWLATRRFRA